MKLTRILLSCYCGILSYLVLFLVFGPNGVVAYGNLARENQAIEKNLETLKEFNADLGLKVNSLTGSRKELARESQKIGYYPTDVRIIRFRDYDAQRTFYNAGMILHADDRVPVAPWALRLVSFIIAVAVFLVLQGRPDRPRRR